jgi:hypothetical protein
MARCRDILEGANLASLDAVLRSFPAGWSRRRALQRLLEAGIPASAADAVALLELLERPSERLWAATTLLDSRALDDGEWGVLLALIASPAAQRRLRWRRRGRPEPG